MVYSGGDWMKAHRWFNTVELFMLPVLLLGGIELVSYLPRKEWNSLIELSRLSQGFAWVCSTILWDF